MIMASDVSAFFVDAPGPDTPAEKCHTAKKKQIIIIAIINLLLKFGSRQELASRGNLPASPHR